jgi:hypothetical protein
MEETVNHSLKRLTRNLGVAKSGIKYYIDTVWNLVPIAKCVYIS